MAKSTFTECNVIRPIKSITLIYKTTTSNTWTTLTQKNFNKAFEGCIKT